MAQAGYTPISLYYSTTPAAVPLNTDLVAGELALNTIDEKLYFKNSAGTVKLLASTASTTNVASISFGTTGLTPSTATTGAVTVGGTLSTANGGTGSTSTTYCSLTSNVTGTLPIGNGGTGQTTASAAFDALNPMTTVGDMIYEGAGPTAVRLPIGTTGQILSVSGGIPTWTAAPSTGLTVGTTPIASGTNGFILFNNAGVLGNVGTTGSGSVVLATSPTLTTPVLGTPTSGTLTNCTGLSLTTGVTGTLPVGNGGTGATTITANSVILGNGTSALNANLVAPGSSGNVLTSNGTTWTSATPGAGAGSLITRTIYTSPATWSKSTNNPGSIIVQVQGGGGGGGGDGGSPNPVGGNSGNTSSFGAFVSATGGAGGGNIGANSPSPGGQGSGGDINVRGNASGVSGPSPTGAGGGLGTVGGSSMFAGGGFGNGTPGFSNSGAGGSGGQDPTNTRGGGGAGGYADRRILAPALGATESIVVGTGGAGGGSFRVGGSGANGIVIVWEYK